MRSTDRVGAGGVSAIRADITTLSADAMVNAANQHLAGVTGGMASPSSCVPPTGARSSSLPRTAARQW